MRPTIGVSSNFNVNRDDPPREQLYLLASYTDAIFHAGALPQPIPLPPEWDDTLLDTLLDRCDGLVFTGGLDLNPRNYSQPIHPAAHVLHDRRDRFEVDLFRRADARRQPTLGLCLGHQLAHVARGGRLIQHLDDLDLHPPVPHRLRNEANALHPVQVTPGSRLAEIVGGARDLEVTSRHHQAVDPDHPGAGLRTVATSADGLIEASEDMERRWLLTVQWHPEDVVDRPAHLALFAALVAATRR